jgi:DNA polymerase III epsilon subunit-like protein
VPINPGAEAIHGIRNEDIVDAPGFNEIMINLVKLTEDRRVIIYNAAFDQRLLRQSAAAHKLRKPCIKSNVVCAMTAYAQFFGEKQTQQNAARQLGLELPTDLHRAIADARLCREIVMAMATTPLPGERQ